jgi:hypothetical protein
LRATFAKGDHDSFSLKELAESAGIERTICFRLLHTLEQEGFVRRIDKRHYVSNLRILSATRFRIGYASQSRDSFSSALSQGLHWAASEMEMDLVELDITWINFILRIFSTCRDNVDLKNRLGRPREFLGIAICAYLENLVFSHCQNSTSWPSISVAFATSSREETMPGRLAVVTLLIPLSVLLALPAHAQFNSAVEGPVTDQSGAVVAAARVTLHNVKTGIDSVANTNASGLYRFLYVALGDVRFRYSSRGLAAVPDFTSSNSPFARKWWTGALGGPIRKGKTFFFFSYEHQSQLTAISSAVSDFTPQFAQWAQANFPNSHDVKDLMLPFPPDRIIPDPNKYLTFADAEGLATKTGTCEEA